MSRTFINIRVRPSLDGLPPLVTIKPDLDVFVIRNRAMTGGRGRGLRLTLDRHAPTGSSSTCRGACRPTTPAW